MSWLMLTVGILGVWRVTHLLHAEDGPGQVIARLRVRLGTSVAGQAMDCFFCLSLWVAAPVALLIGATWTERVLAWPALSAAAIVIERLMSRLGRPPIAHYIEDPTTEEDDVPMRAESARRTDTH